MSHKMYCSESRKSENEAVAEFRIIRITIAELRKYLVGSTIAQTRITHILKFLSVSLI